MSEGKEVLVNPPESGTVRASLEYLQGLCNERLRRDSPVRVQATYLITKAIEAVFNGEAVNKEGVECMGRAAFSGDFYDKKSAEIAWEILTLFFHM